MQSNIIVTLQIEGTHQWSACPIEEVAFLKHPHRHIFHIECKKQVSHHDRDIEIIQLKRNIQYYLLDKYGIGHKSAEGCEFGELSCEQIATILLNKFELNYCKVLEDGENGAEIFL